MGLRRRSSLDAKLTDTPEDTPVETSAPSKKSSAQLTRAKFKTTPKRADQAHLRPARLVCSDPDLEKLITQPPPELVAANQKQIEHDAAERVAEAKQRLGGLENEVISALFPNTGFPESFESIAARLGMTIKEVQEVADNALRGLRGVKGSPPRISSAWN
jgi:hypothetical protein